MAEPRNRYSTVSLVLHWLIAALVIGQVVLIYLHEAAGEGPDPFIGLHKSGGATILILTLVRIGWRLANPAIPLPATTPRWQKVAARTTHVLFYVLLLAFPLTGWIAGSATGRGFEYYGLFDFPLLPVGGGRGTAGLMMGIHTRLPILLYLLIGLHVAGALKHHLIDRDNVLHRMIPLIPRRP